MKRPILVLQLFLTIQLLAGSGYAEFRAGAAAVNVTPPELPVIQNGGFVESQLRLVADPIFVRALVLQQTEGGEKIAIAVVDSCMMDREFCDRVKATAAEKTGIPRDKILLSATHTHSAPSVMDFCLGSRKDPKYSEFLPGRIVAAIVKANASLRPAKVAWTRFDAGDYTKTRRWAFRSGIERNDPFGNPTVRANMHPGHLNPDAIGETGPTDPWFTLLSIRDTGDKPLAVLGNFSMHYFSGHSGVSADYFGYYVRAVAQKLAPGDDRFVAILSQGTSGDLWRADYSKPKPKKAITIQEYAGQLAEMSVAALADVPYRADLPVAMAESRLTIGRRVPDAARLEWARGILEKMGDKRPRNQQEVYAEQAIFLHENPKAEVVLQAARIGGIGITAIPNEVYALTGLKLKHRSPFDLTMNIELANGASGYIPPPEQHPLGGYNTWPARTAGLVVDAETRIVDGALELLEKVSGKPRREYREPATDYSLAVLKSNPTAFWRLGDMDGTRPRDEAAGQLQSSYEPGVVFHLAGVGESRCAQFAGGRVAAKMAKRSADYSVAFWFWNGVRHDARPVTGYLFSRGKGGDASAAGDHLGIGGKHSHGGRLFLFNGDEKEALLGGKTGLGVKKWHHVSLVRKGGEIVVYLDGREEIRGKLEPTHAGSDDFFIGGRNDNFANFEGRLDEVAFYDRALTGPEARALYAASAPLESPPSSPQQTIEQSHVRDGFTLELVAAEPLVVDPVAVDWGADGSVWVAEMSDYPYGVEGGGRVAHLFDSDGDGRLDKRDNFLADLSFPAGVMSWGKGVIVAAAPDIIYAEDRDGDGEAEHREKLFSGFIEGNQQLRVNGLRLGLDGWIYCASGGHHAGFGTKTVITSHRSGKKINLGSRDFRFKMDGSFEPESGPSQFGRVRDDFGNWFGVQNAHPLWHYVLPDRYLRRNPDAAAPDPRQQLRDHMPRLYPAKASQKRFHGFDHVGRYTSACGISIYRDGLLFPRIEGETIAFTCAPFHNVVQRHVLKPHGFTFSGARADDGDIDFFASRDRWCRPVMSRTAPDGSLWIVDMYRYMIEHPDWLPPAGKDELRPHYRAGEDRGRIYRIYPEGKKPEPFKGLHKGVIAGSNGIVNDLVLRSNVEIGELSAASPAGRALVLARGLFRAPFLTDPSPGVRALSLRLLEAEPQPPKKVLALADDPSGHVQLQLAFSLGEWESAEAGQCLVKLALANGGDKFFRAAVLSSAKPHFDTLLRELVTNPAADRELVRALLKMASEEQALEILTRIEKPDANHYATVAEWLRGRRKYEKRFEALFATAIATAKDPSAPTDLRVEAISFLGDRDGVARGFLSSVPDPALTRAAIATLCERGLAKVVFDRWQVLSPVGRAFCIEESLATRVNTGALLAALADRVNPLEVSAGQRQRLLESKDATVRKSAAKIFSKGNPDRALVAKGYDPALALAGDAAKGSVHFANVCASCHQLDDVGKAIGPDLRTITNRTKSALLVAILDPNRSVEPRYLGYTAERKGDLVYGMISAETATSLIFNLPDGSTQPVARKDIVGLDSSRLSFMPDGLEATLDHQAMADLLAFLEEKLNEQKKE